MLGLHKGLRPALTAAQKRIAMDYVIGGVMALLLFAYLIYALLRPEKF